METGRVLVTGSEGLIGRIIVPDLEQAGYEVWRLDRVELERPRYIRADISYPTFPQTVAEQLPRVDSIVHLAACSHVDASWQEIEGPNILGVRHIYELAINRFVPHIVLASSNHVTGGYESSLVLGDMIYADNLPWPDSVCGLSKLFAENTAMRAVPYGVSTNCLRIGSVRAEDDPTISPRLMKTWLSHRDCRQLFQKALARCDRFQIYYGVSNNDGRFWSIENARHELAYKPLDNAAEHMR